MGSLLKIVSMTLEGLKKRIMVVEAIDMNRVCNGTRVKLDIRKPSQLGIRDSINEVCRRLWFQYNMNICPSSTLEVRFF